MEVLKPIERFEVFEDPFEWDARGKIELDAVGMAKKRLHPRIRLTLRPRGWGKDGVQYSWGDKTHWEIFFKRADTNAVYIGHHTRKQTGVEYFFYRYKDRYYISEIKLSEDEVALIIESEDKKRTDSLRREVERIKAKAEMENAVRQPIPKDVQILVWDRDKGKCVECGSNENLEFDHIIPISKGGSNTARNIQLLCEKCNRAKSNKIGG